MVLWRITQAKFAADALSGEGGVHASGRWHVKGNRVVYCASSLSLAMLEMLVHFDQSTSIRLARIAIHVPDDVAVESVERRRLPRAWRSYPAPSMLARLGTEWLQAARTAVLRVPSAIVETEHSFLINPAHRDARRIRATKPIRFELDSRLRK
jgi:RES domain-containing protein